MGKKNGSNQAITHANTSTMINDIDMFPVINNFIYTHSHSLNPRLPSPESQIIFAISAISAR